MVSKIAIIFSSYFLTVFSKTQTYYIAVEEETWDFAPKMPLNGAGDTWLLGNAPDRIGHIYKKARYIEYTDESFSSRKAVPSEWQHKHILGPIIRAQVGDDIQIFFKNNGKYNYTIDPHGITFKKGNPEGVFYKGVTPLGGVAPGDTFTYFWHVQESAGPSDPNLSSIVWMYHSFADETADTNSGLVGAIIISRQNTPLDANGKPTDIDKEFVLLWTIFDEGVSNYLSENIAKYTTGQDPTTLINDPDFYTSNLMHSANGRVFNNVEGLEMKVGDKVRWYIMALGTEADLHPIHWHGATTRWQYSQTDTVLLLPGSMATIDSVLDSAGSWFVHCHVNDHIISGMIAEYHVTGQTITPNVNRVNEYFIAVEEQDWNFAPKMPSNNAGDTWLLGTADDRIGHIYKKALYIEYTDITFTTKKPISPTWNHTGILGPVIRAQVGDLIKINFKNNGHYNYSMHPHGVFYDKKSEGVWINGITLSGGVPPGEQWTYEWYVPERAGPADEDPSSIVWLYHSHVDETTDTSSGLVGAMIISRKNVLIDSNGKPDDIDKEFILYFTVMNEGLSNYLKDNFDAHTIGQNFTSLSIDPEFQESNLLHNVNGYVFNNVPGLQMEVGDKVRWYIMSLGTEVDLHSIHFHATTTIYKKRRTDVINLLPAASATFDSDIDSAGSWFVHCHVNDHIIAGMVAEYHVSGNTTTPAAPKVTHDHYVAVVEELWDYSPNMPTHDAGNTWLNGTANNRIGHRYKKARYVEYTDSTFTVKKEVSRRWIHKGILGPIFRAQVGDLIQVYFMNTGTYNYSMHPHGVFYDKASEGAWVNGVTPQGGVPPGKSHVYRWYVTERAGPYVNDPSSIAWLYHSHVDETADTNGGLIGAIIVSRKDTPITAHGRPTDIDREFILFFTVMNENNSPYLLNNIKDFTTGQNSTTLPDDEDFQESNLLHSINGRVYNNVHGLTMDAGEKVRWYIMALGTEVDLHGIHWHGVTTVYRGARTDVVQLLPASMATIDTIPNTPGNWLVHCHVNDHILAGMVANFTVRDVTITPSFIIQNEKILILASIALFFILVLGGSLCYFTCKSKKESSLHSIQDSNYVILSKSETV